MIRRLASEKEKAKKRERERERKRERERESDVNVSATDDARNGRGARSAQTSKYEEHGLAAAYLHDA